MRKALIVAFLITFSVFSHNFAMALTYRGTVSRAEYAVIAGPQVHATAYASLTAAVAAIGSTEVDLLIDNTTTLTANTTVPNNVRLIVTRKGRISRGAYTLAINGPYDAGLSQVFTGTGTVTFGAGSVEKIFPQWWGAKGDGVTDDTVAIRAAIDSMMASTASIPAYLVAGTYLVSSQIITGNTAGTVQKYFQLQGDGWNSIITSSAAIDGLITIQGVNPDLDGAGNRHNGRVSIKDLKFAGTGAYTGNAIKTYGVQGVQIDHVFIQHYNHGIDFSNTDLVTIKNSWLHDNSYGIFHKDVGALFASGTGNSFIIRDNIFDQNTTCGLFYYGGLAPNIIGNNFVANARSLALSDNSLSGGGPSVTINPLIIGNYFETDSVATMVLGNVGGGYVKGGKIMNNMFYQGSGTITFITVNYLQSMTPTEAGRLRIVDNTMHGPGTWTAISQPSVFKAEYNALGLDMPGVFASLTADTYKTSTITKSLATTASADFLKVGSYGSIAALHITIHGSSSGRLTVKRYSVVMIGGGVVVAGSIFIESTQDYTTASPFTLTMTQNSPSAGENKLTLTNDDGVTSSFVITYTVEYKTGTLTEL